MQSRQLQTLKKTLIVVTLLLQVFGSVWALAQKCCFEENVVCVTAGASFSCSSCNTLGVADNPYLYSNYVPASENFLGPQLNYLSVNINAIWRPPNYLYLNI